MPPYVPRVKTSTLGARQRTGGLLFLGGADAIVGDEAGWIGVAGRASRGDDRLARVDLGGNGQIELQELSQQVLPSGEAVRFKHSRVESSVNVLEGMFAG